MTPEINENETLDTLLERARAEGHEEDLNGDIKSEREGLSPDDTEGENESSGAEPLVSERASTSESTPFSLEEKAFYEERLAQMEAEMTQVQNAALYWQNMAHSSSVYAQEMGGSMLSQLKETSEAQLQAAKISKKAAYESGDLEAQVIADADMMKATATLHWIENQSVSGKKAKTASPQTESRRTGLNQTDLDHSLESEAELHPSVYEWVEKNPWMDELNPLFEPEKAEAVVRYAAHLERSLTRSGRSYEINSPSYFKRLEQYAQKFEDSSAPVARSEQRTPLLKPSLSQKESASQTLTSSEKEICSALGISQKSYLKNREYDRKQQAFKQGNQIYGEIK